MFQVGVQKKKIADSEQLVSCVGFPAAVSLELGDGATDDLGLVNRLSAGPKWGQAGVKGESRSDKISASIPKQGKAHGVGGVGGVANLPARPERLSCSGGSGRASLCVPSPHSSLRPAGNTNTV